MINKAKITETINKLYSDAVVQLWNNYCYEVDGSGDYIYQMAEFDDIITASGMKPLNIVRAVFYGSFCPADNYFWFNGYGNLQSCNFPKDDNSGSPFDANAIADYIIDNNDPLHCNEIRKMLEGGIEA